MSNTEKDVKVVVNAHGEYSIWSASRDIPDGWHDVGRVGIKEECLDYIEGVWLTETPLRAQYPSKHACCEHLSEELTKFDVNKRPETGPRDLVKHLAQGKHAIELCARSNRHTTINEIAKEPYAFVNFPNTQGGTLLRVPTDTFRNTKINKHECDVGYWHLEGETVLNHVKIRCILHIDGDTLAGEGYVKILS